MARGDILGWFLVGPMKAVCIEDAPDQNAARKIVGGTVSAILPIRNGYEPSFGSVECCECGKVLP